MATYLNAFNINIGNKNWMVNMNFKDLNISENLIKVLKSSGITEGILQVNVTVVALS